MSDVSLAGVARTFSITAMGGGESCRSFRKCSRVSAPVPASSPSSPSEVLRTHPPIRYFSASLWRKGRKPTPWTMPDTIRRIRVMDSRLMICHPREQLSPPGQSRPQEPLPPPGQSRPPQSRPPVKAASPPNAAEIFPAMNSASSPTPSPSRLLTWKKGARGIYGMIICHNPLRVKIEIRKHVVLI